MRMYGDEDHMQVRNHGRKPIGGVSNFFGPDRRRHHSGFWVARGRILPSHFDCIRRGGSLGGKAACTAGQQGMPPLSHAAFGLPAFSILRCSSTRRAENGPPDLRHV